MKIRQVLKSQKLTLIASAVYDIFDRLKYRTSVLARIFYTRSG